MNINKLKELNPIGLRGFEKYILIMLKIILYFSYFINCLTNSFVKSTYILLILTICLMYPWNLDTNIFVSADSFIIKIVVANCIFLNLLFSLMVFNFVSFTLMRTVFLHLSCVLNIRDSIEIRLSLIFNIL